MAVDETGAGYDRLRADVTNGLTWRAGWGMRARHKVCIMSSMVPMAESVADCTAAGWPPWLSYLLIWLWQEDVVWDATHAAQTAADNWGLKVARAVAERTADWEAIRWRWLRGVWDYGAMIDETGRLQQLVDMIDAGRQQELLDNKAEAIPQPWTLAWYRLGPDHEPFDALTAGTAVLTSWDHSFMAAWEAGNLASGRYELPLLRNATCTAAARAIVVLREHPTKFPEYLGMPGGRGEMALISGYRGWGMAAHRTLEVADRLEQEQAMRRAIFEARAVAAGQFRGLILRAIQES